ASCRGRFHPARVKRGHREVVHFGGGPSPPEAARRDLKGFTGGERVSGTKGRPGQEPKTGPIDRWIPLLGVLRSYDRRWLRGDLIPGVTVAALIVPKNPGYAGLAGLPLHNGF